MINSPTISVVMPVFNGEKFLRESIESILNQSYKDFEFLIIYDKSTDNTASIIQEFERIDSRICVLYGDGDGIIGALNKGIRESALILELKRKTVGRSKHIWLMW